MTDHEGAQGTPFLRPAAAPPSRDPSHGAAAPRDTSRADRVATTRHFGALLGKNAVLKQREWSATCCPWCPLAACCELVLPLAVLLLLWWARGQCNEGGQCRLPVLAGWGGTMPKGNYTTECYEGLQLHDDRGNFAGYSSCKAWTDYFMRPLPFVDVLAYLHFSGKRLALAAEDAGDIPKVERFRTWVTEHWYPEMRLKDIPCMPLEQDFIDVLERKKDNSTLACMPKAKNPGRLPGFANLTQPSIYSAADLQAYLDSADYGSDGVLFGAVVFSKLGGRGELGAPGEWSYSIRLNVSSQTSPYTGVPSTRPLDLGLRMKEATTYLDSSFVSLQLLIDRYIIGNRSEHGKAPALLEANGMWNAFHSEIPHTADQLAEPLRYAPQSLEAIPLPVSGVVVDGFFEIVSVVFPLVFIVAFLYTQKKVLNELITEKESKVRESMRMLGVTSTSIIGSWYVTYALIFGGLCFVFALVAGAHVFPRTSSSLIFAFFWLWSMSFLAFAFFVHSFFNHSRTGGIVGMMIMFAQWVLYASQNRSGPPSPGVMTLLMLMPNGAFCAGLSMLAKYESAQIGGTWSNLQWPVENSTMGTVLLMMVFDVGFWTLLGWYFDRVLPKEYGVRLPLNFPCLPSYWVSRPAGGESDLEAALGPEVPAACAGRDAAEAVPEAIRARSVASGTMVRTIGLRKEFSTPGGTKVAVAGLDLTMYEGQILALLGHNGAGKSTTIHMLTGMVTPTSGDAVVAGFSLRTGISEIRRLIGVCPQHDVLWLELTVSEHLGIYAKLRGVPAPQVAARVSDLMLQVGLTEKEHTRAGSLSGGQKRKLSLCLALIGRPRVCFLDEPTSGMDPFSRRSTWNIIRGVREDRVIVLTTHFMDEADILGDRIAIMADGVLQCCGSALFLKARFGAGYRVTCVRRPARVQDGAASPNPASESAADLIRRHVPQAELLTDVGAELSMRLPTGAAGKFPALFAELDARLVELDVEHYGLSMVTMEEVFLRVASGEMATLERTSSGTIVNAGMPAPAQGPDLSRLQALPAVASPNSHLSSPPARVGLPRRARSHAIGIVARHTGSLFMKRARYGRRDFKSIACTVLLPVVLLAFGLWLLQRASERHLPAVLLSVEEQYGDRTEVPYNSSGAQAASWLDLAALSGVRVVAEDVPRGSESGFLFGKNYSEGLPLVNMCEEKPQPEGPASKCWREWNFCEKPFPAFMQLPVGNFWDALQLLQQTGIGVTCRSDRIGCRQAFHDACADGGRQCANICYARSQGKISRSVCEQQCGQICGMASNMSVLCDLVPPNHTIGYFCPQGCADWNDLGNTCEPGTTCFPPPPTNAADPTATLDFALRLFGEGMGRDRQDTRYGAILATTNASVGLTVTLLYNTSAVHAVPVFVNLATSALKRGASGEGSSIRTTSDPMPRTKTEILDRVVSALVNLTSTFVIIIAFSWIPAAIVAYVVREREAHHNSKHQQLISGVSLIAYWTANILWDVCVYMAPLSLSMAFIWGFDIDVFVDNGAFWATAVTFLGYGLAIAPFSYLISFLFAKHTTAQVLCLVINFVTGLLLMVVSYILSAIDNTKDVNESLMWIYRLFPGFCLGHGLFQICTNSIAASQFGIDLQIDLLGWDVAGKDVLYLYTSAPVYFLLVVCMDYALHSPLAAASKHLDPCVTGLADTTEEEDDPDVAAEALRVADGRADEDVVRIANLRKVYRTPEGRPKVAVRNLSFGLRRGECFGFLGINGAGKTSTLNMLTGAVLPSSGTAYVGGHDIVLEQWQVRRLLGYCPQHDALLDRLTVREHLELFGRIKCIPVAELRGYCDRMMQDLSLSDHVNKMAMTLSGGNKRKLSLAISLMGAPPLILLDEPSTGVDPAARRLMWDVISSISTGLGHCSVMLTTHNMEEAEALCSRIGIMVGGRLRCIGSNQRLKARFGRGYQLEARLRCPDEDQIRQVVEARQLPPSATAADLPAICSRLGCLERAALVREGCEEGYVVHEALAREGAISAHLLAEWWLLQDLAEGLERFLQQHFPGTVPLERHERTMRYRLPSASRLSEIFRLLEQHRSALQLEEYGISQTSLEQIFNDFAARQDEETAAVRGLVFSAPSPASSRPGAEGASAAAPEDSMMALEVAAPGSPLPRTGVPPL